VVKPAIRDHFYNKVKKKAYKVENQQQLIEVYNFVNSIIDSSEILVQEFLNGGPKNLYSFCPFYKKGEIKASITARRFRQHPMDFGHATTFAETVQIPELEYFAAKFLKEIDYYGICEVEFMYDHSENVYKLIEVNPRVWGWHSLAIAAGADLPYLLYLDLTGGKSLISEIKSNLKWVRLTTDSATVAKEILKGRLNLFDYIRSLSGKKSFAVFSWNDPLPFFTEIFLIPYLWKKRGF
jgi:predicted ATP-grasp superfamily ATP-dependent carboligase